MKITIYTTSPSKWYRTKAKNVENAYAPYFPLTFTFKTIDVPKKPVFKVDKDGDKCLDWDWFNQTFQGDAKGFHFDKKTAKKWGIKLGGQRNSNSKDFPQFWLTCDKEKAKGYDFSNFERLLYHEPAHFWEDIDDKYGNKLVQGSVHHADYDLKKIHEYHLGVDFSLLTNEGKVSFLKGLLAKLQALLIEQPSPFLKGNYKVTQEFGVFNPIYTKTKHHIGVDIACPIGTPILAPLNGTVIQEGKGNDTGNFVIFKTFDRYYRFCHLSQFKGTGTYLKGEPIAFSGNTGLSTGPHVHAELWKTPPDISILTEQNFKNYLTKPI